jgi:hypothetical protein
VKAVTASRACGIASCSRILCLMLWMLSVRLFLSFGGLSTAIPAQVLNTHAEDRVRMTNIGAARKKSGRLDSVQYFRKPTFLGDSQL